IAIGGYQGRHQLSTPWMRIKGIFTKRYLAAGGRDGPRNESRRRKGEAPFGKCCRGDLFARASLGLEGQTSLVYWKITDVMVKKDGKWKFVHIHVSATQ
ncbi:hypothetical protein MJD09_21245, partial [bacterium]|nr:hypothetical protein [bacterium]